MHAFSTVHQIGDGQWTCPVFLPLRKDSQISEMRAGANVSYLLLWWQYVGDGHVINV